MKNKHLTHNERIEIEKGLNENCSFKEIAARTDKSLSTISKEIKIHRYAKEAIITMYQIYIIKGNSLVGFLCERLFQGVQRQYFCS